MTTLEMWVIVCYIKPHFGAGYAYAFIRKFPPLWGNNGLSLIGQGSSCPSVLHFVLRLSVEGRPQGRRKGIHPERHLALPIEFLCACRVPDPTEVSRQVRGPGGHRILKMLRQIYQFLFCVPVGSPTRQKPPAKSGNLVGTEYLRC